jgi:RNA polymerase sigma-70 factor (ECF subfamily)
MAVAVGEQALEAQVEAALEGDDAAWGALYDALAPDVHRLLVGLGALGRAEVEDAVQETFVRLVRDLPRFDRSRALRPFVLGVARHVAIDAMRRRRTIRQGVERVASEARHSATEHEPSSETAVKAEQRARVQEALAAVEPELRSLLVLRHTSRVTMRELAESADCSVPTARQRLGKAARRFAVELKQRGVIPPSWAGEEAP